MKNIRNDLHVRSAYRNTSNTRTTLVQKIIQLESEAAPLEPNAAIRKDMTKKVFDYADSYLNTLPTLPAYTVGNGLYHSPITENGEEIEKLLAVLRDEVDNSGLNPASGWLYSRWRNLLLCARRLFS